MSESIEYYIPGSNANVITIRKEVGRDPMNNPGTGEIDEIIVTAEEAFKFCSVHKELLEALKSATDQLEAAVSGGNIDTEIVDDILERKALSKATPNTEEAKGER